MDKRPVIFHFFLIVLSVFVVGCGGGGSSVVLSELGNIELNQDSSVEIDLNPGEPAGTPYIYSIQTQPKYGSLAPGKDYRHWVYTPARNYSGPDSFSFEASAGTAKKSANAAISVKEIVVANRPMSVKFYELVSLAPGELRATWFNSFDIDGNHSNIRYHLYLSTDKDFYPSETTLVQTVTDTVMTTLTGLVENRTYYVAILAEDADGKLSRSIDKQEIQLITSKLVLQDGVRVVTTSELPYASATLTDTEVSIQLTAPHAPLTGEIIQLDDANGYASVRLESAVAINNSEHRYQYTVADPKDFIKEIAFSSVQGSYDPSLALIQYYKDAGGDIDALMHSRFGAAADAGYGEYLELLLATLLEWGNFNSIDELYRYLTEATTVNINEFSSERYGCGSLDPEFEPLDPLGWSYDPLEFRVGVHFACELAYTVSLRWDDVLRSEPEHLSAEFEGTVTATIEGTGRLQGQFLSKALELPRRNQIAFTRVIPVYGPIAIPVVLAFNAKGTLQGEGYGELKASWDSGIKAGINYGIQYKAGTGFTQLGAGIISPAVVAAGDDSITEGNFDQKYGVKLQSRVGPEVILSIVNAAPSYKLGFDGLAIAKSNVGPALSFELEAHENPEIAVQRLGAYPFGIGKYEWTGNIGADMEMSLIWPRAAKAEFSFEPVSVPFFRLPDFELEYQDKAIGSSEFEVTAVDQNIIGFSADLVRNETRWHIFEPREAVLTPGTSDLLRVDGKWTNYYDADSTIIFEYLPDTLASLVASATELTKPIAKQYRIYEPKFLLDGKWSARATTDADFVGSLLFYCVDQELMLDVNFNYDEVNRNYQQLINSYEVIRNDSRIDGGILDVMYQSLFSTTESPYVAGQCYEKPEWYSGDTPLLAPSTGNSANVILSVERYMTGNEFESKFLTSVAGGGAGYVDVAIVGPDEFRMSVSAPHMNTSNIYVRQHR